MMNNASFPKPDPQPQLAKNVGVVSANVEVEPTRKRHSTSRKQIFSIPASCEPTVVSNGVPSRRLALARAQDSTAECLVSMLREKGTMEMAVDALIRNLTAKSRFYDKAAKKMIEVEDGATQVRAASLLISNEVGEPVKRQQILTGQVESTDEVVEKLSRSPSGIAALKKIIAEAEAKAQISP